MSDEKQRHGCLTAWLVLMVVANSLMAALYLFRGVIIKENYSSAPAWAPRALALVGIANVVFSVALLRWKKWGFFGFVVASGVAFVVNLKVGLSVVQAVSGLAGIAILYGALQIGKENKGWPQLE